MQLTISKIFLALSVSLLPLSGFSETYSDEDLLTKTVYELELIPKKQLLKDQRKQVKSQIKSNRKKDCIVKQDEFFEIPLSELQSLNEKGMSKSERKMYRFILKNREKLEKIRQVPSFSISRDDFEETTTFNTSTTTKTGFDKNVCPFRGMNWGNAGTDSTIRWFARARTSNGTELDYLQFYLRFSPQHFISNPYISVLQGYESDWYYGVSRVVGKGYGNLNYRMIDHSFSVSEHGTQHFHDIAINVTKEQLTDWYKSGEGIAMRIYSKNGHNLDTKIPYPQISTVYEGIVKAGF